MKKSTIKPPPKNDYEGRMTKQRAMKCPVLKLVIKYCDNELATYMRVNLAPMIKNLDLGQHRAYIRKHFKGVVREILEERFGPLIAVTHDGQVAGVGGGSYTAGYRRPVEAYQSVADASLARKQGIATGIGGSHNDLAGAISAATGNGRDTMEVHIVPRIEKKEEPPLIAKSVEFTKSILKGWRDD